MGPVPGSVGAPGLSPQRGRLLDELRRQGPLTVAALATAAGVHQNTVREHLEALTGLRLVTRERSSSPGRGRPAWVYRSRSPQESPAIHDHASLAIVLAGRIACSSRDPGADAEAAGRDWGRALIAGRRPAASPSAARHGVVTLLSELGFAPQPDRDRRSIRLRACPILDAAREHPRVVCAVHAGMIGAALEGLGAPQDAARVTLEPFALPGGCRLRIGVAGRD
jgi:predicted ArsR family transcriptional regulator